VDPLVVLVIFLLSISCRLIRCLRCTGCLSVSLLFDLLALLGLLGLSCFGRTSCVELQLLGREEADWALLGDVLNLWYGQHVAPEGDGLMGVVDHVDVELLDDLLIDLLLSLSELWNDLLAKVHGLHSVQLGQFFNLN